MNTKLLAQLALIFIVTQGIGLWVGNFLIQEDIHSTIVNDDPNDAINSIGLIVWILGFTAVLILLIRFAPDWLLTFILKAIESLAIFGTTIIVLFPLYLTDEITLLIAMIFVASRIIFQKSLLLRNASSTIAAAGAGALIGASLGVFPILAFIVLLSIYDLIAVFKTKHMVELAKGVTKKNLSFTYVLPTKEHQFELGTGDMVVPLAFAVSVLGQAKLGLPEPFYFVPPVLVLFASLCGLMFTVHVASMKKGTALPALPLQTVLMVVVYGITVLLM